MNERFTDKGWVPRDFIMRSHKIWRNNAAEFITVDRGDRLNTKERNFFLFRAVKEGNLPMVKGFVSCGASVNQADPYYKTPLIYAVAEGHLEVARYLLEQGADVNYRDVNPAMFSTIGQTALHYAVENHNVKMVQLLMEFGVDPYRERGGGNTALMDSQDDEITELLLNYTPPKFSFWEQVRRRFMRFRNSLSEAGTGGGLE